MQIQLPLFTEQKYIINKNKNSRSGTFIDNMNLPVHQWFRYSAGFSAEWVQKIINKWGLEPGHILLDPFAGSGTVMLVADSLGIRSVGIDAHPFVHRICNAKLHWGTDYNTFISFITSLTDLSAQQQFLPDKYPPLIHKSFSKENLAALDKLKHAWQLMNDGSPTSELAWLAITSILRPTSRAGTAQWQYILPNKEKKNVLTAEDALRIQVEMMVTDMIRMQSNRENSRAENILGDARILSEIVSDRFDGVITSPPYANNYDYADALRFEMTFWGEVESWGDLHEKVRKYLLVSSSQHSSKERLVLEELLEDPVVFPIQEELAKVTRELAIVRESHGGKKHYHTMIAAYCRDISLVLKQLRKVSNDGVQMCWVIGDSAPYGVYCPIDEWIGTLALAAGFTHTHFEKLRDRNIKWKNRKHNVPLKEGLLYIEG